MIKRLTLELLERLVMPFKLIWQNIYIGLVIIAAVTALILLVKLIG